MTQDQKQEWDPAHDLKMGDSQDYRDGYDKGREHSHATHLHTIDVLTKQRDEWQVLWQTAHDKQGAQLTTISEQAKTIERMRGALEMVRPKIQHLLGEREAVAAAIALAQGEKAA